MDLIFIIEQMTILQNDGNYPCKTFMAPNRSIRKSFVSRISRSAAKHISDYVKAKWRESV